MKLRFETSVAAPTWVYPPGAVVEVSHLTPDFQQWIAQGLVRVIRDPDVGLESPEVVDRAVEYAGRPFVPRLVPGGTVVCLGCGPSLTQDDVDAVRGKALVIAINDAYRLAPWADVFYAADCAWWRHHWTAVRDLAGLKLSIRSADMQLRDPDAVTFLDNTGVEGLEIAPTGLRNGKNSGYQAIGVAVHLGATRIVLLGYDMGHKRGKKSHFFGDHPNTLNRHSPYNDFLECFQTIVQPLRKAGVMVINASRQTALACFERRSLEDVFASDREAVA